MSPHYRVDHNGSLLRPAKLREAVSVLYKGFDAEKEGTPEQEAHLEAVTKESIEEVAQQQLQHGISTITSGEFERRAFWDGLYENLTGMKLTYIPFSTGKWRPGFPINERVIAFGMEGRMARQAGGKIKRARPAYLDAWLALRSCLPEEQWKHAKVNVISPTWFHEMLEEPYLPESGYTSDKEYLKDVSDALREEVLELYENGLRIVQIDDPILSMLYTEEWEPVLRKHGTDVERLVDLYIWTHNNFLAGLPDDLTVIVHLCRGNTPGQTLTGGYNKLVEKLFNDCNHKLFNLEWHQPEQHGDFSPLKHLPEGKAVILGLISAKTPEMEDIEAVRGRLYEAADVIASARGISREAALNEHLAVSPQCGFSSGPVHPDAGMDVDKQWEKMGLLQTLAEQVWPGWRADAGLSRL